jgi:hypothetical protein
VDFYFDFLGQKEMIERKGNRQETTLEGGTNEKKQIVLSGFCMLISRLVIHFQSFGFGNVLASSSPSASLITYLPYM